MFEEPTRADVRWSDFIALYRALGGDKPKTGKTAGSRRRLRLRGVKAVLHEPHPRPEMPKGSVESARDLLRNAGATPVKEGCECSRS
jgi:hypothetical protein